MSRRRRRIVRGERSSESDAASAPHADLPLGPPSAAPFCRGRWRVRRRAMTLGHRSPAHAPHVATLLPNSPPNGARSIVEPFSILHVVAPAAFGGLETVLRALASGLARRGHRVKVAVVITPDDSSHPFARALEADGVGVEAVCVGPRQYRRERRALHGICERMRPDVVHTHGFRPDVIDSGVGRAHGAALVSTCHGFIETDLRGLLYQWVQRQALRKFDAVVAVSRPIHDRLRRSGIADSKLHLVPNGLTIERAASRLEARRELGVGNESLIGWVGRLSSEKGPDIALDAFARVAHPDACLALIGAGREEDALRARANALHVADRVRWLGAVPDAGKLFSAFDAFLLSSRTEGTPMALLEAMAAGVPVVATRVGGVPDIVDDAVAALIESEDVAGIASALDQALGAGDLVQARAAKARERIAERYGSDAWLNSYEHIYSLVSPRRTARSSIPARRAYDSPSRPG